MSKKQKFLEKLDIFGVEINIKFNQLDKHTTRFGGVVTLIIIGILCLMLSSSINEMIYKQNPIIVQDQRLVDNPARFNLTKENFSFVVTLLDEKFEPLMDEKIYRLDGNFLYKERIQNEDGTFSKGEFKNRKIQLTACNSDKFQVQNTIEYFHSLKYEKMYCLEVDDLYLQGQFEMEDFSVIEVRVVPCEQGDSNNQTECIDKQVQTKILSRSILQVYFNNQIFQFSDHKQPFKSVGQSHFWETNLDYQSNINLLFQNTYVEDDVGLITSKIKTTKNLMFSSERTMTSSKEDLSFYKISLYLEKNKEQYYRRTYLKIPEALSKVGGCMIAQPYSQLQLHRKLFNQTFQISKNQNQKSPQNDKANLSLEKQIQQAHQKNITSNETQFEPKSDRKIQFSISPKAKSSKLRKQLSQKQENLTAIKRRISLFNVNQKEDSFEKGEKKKLKNLAKKFKNQMTNLKVKTTEYLSFYFNCFNIFRSNISDMVKFGTEKIYNYTDICFIVNKLLEIEKLKHLILNDQQIKLFEFIPKPKIDLEVIGQLKKSDNSNNLKTQTIQNLQNDEDDKNSQQFQSAGDVNSVDNLSIKGKKQINILSIQNRTLSEKAFQAQTAFNNIYKNQIRKSKVDLKLIQMLDENLVQLFNNNTFDESTINSGSNLGQNINDVDTLTQSINKGILSNYKIKFEKSQFQSLKNTEQDSESLDPNEEMAEIPGTVSITEQAQSVSVYGQKQKHFITHTELKNSNLQTQTKEDCFTEYDIQNNIVSPHNFTTESNQLAFYELPNIEGLNREEEEEEE